MENGKKKNVEAACFPASNSKPTCLESGQLTFGKLNTSSGCQSAKNKPEASSHGADYFRRRESMMENASRRRQPPRVCFCLFLQLLSAPSRSGPLLLPPYNNGWGASTEWDPIIGAIVYNIHKLTCWHALRKGWWVRECWLLEGKWLQGDQYHLSEFFFFSFCNHWDGKYLNNPDTQCKLKPTVLLCLHVFPLELQSQPD